MGRGLRSLGSLGVVVALCAVLPASASAAFHLVKISEVSAGGGAGEGFVELQMFAAGQGVLHNHAIKIYDAAGSVVATSTLAGDAANDRSQRTYLIGGSAFSGGADETDSAIDFLNDVAGGGAACWVDGDPPDCVSWGAFLGNSMLPAPGAGSPVPEPLSTPGVSLQRDVSANCASALDAADDTDDSEADFFLGPPQPNPNSEPAPTLLCPQTKITDGPPKRTSKARAKFRFKSNEANSVFECKLDKAAFKPCESPAAFRVKHGRHTLKVRATNPLQGVDASPDSYRWKRTQGGASRRQAASGPA